jgi:hypothetical protein
MASLHKELENKELIGRGEIDLSDCCNTVLTKNPRGLLAWRDIPDALGLIETVLETTFEFDLYQISAYEARNVAAANNIIESNPRCHNGGVKFAPISSMILIAYLFSGMGTPIVPTSF